MRNGDKAGSQPESVRSEEHTSELHSRFDIVCRLLLEKKNNAISSNSFYTSSRICPASCWYRDKSPPIGTSMSPVGSKVTDLSAADGPSAVTAYALLRP